MPAGFSAQREAGYQTKTVDSKSLGPKFFTFESPVVRIKGSLSLNNI